MHKRPLSRRDFIFGGAAVAAIGPLVRAAATAQTTASLPIRTITRGPKFHWFAYYDKLQFDPSGTRVLGMEVDFEHRSPTPDDVIRVGMVDLSDGDRWTELGESRCWCWQQGCMLQWRPGSTDEILWNDREDGRFVCRILNVNTGVKRTVPYPVYAVSPDGRAAVAPDFRRIQDTRPGYGYCGLADPNRDDPAPEDSGIFRIDLDTGRRRLIIPLSKIAALGELPGDPKAPKHYFNHLLFNTDGSRFIFLHRWLEAGRRSTRMLTAAPDGSDINIVDSYGRTSHFIWRDPGHILAWAWHPSHKGAFYLFEDGTDKVEAVGPDVMTRDGHCTYLPGNKWILNDSYPDRNRNQPLYLYNVATGKVVELGKFNSPRQYTGEWRCDLHARFSPDGRNVVIDSPHTGRGRQMHLIDISSIVG